MNYKKIISSVMCLCMTVPMTANFFPPKTNAIVIAEDIKTSIYDIYMYKNYGEYVEITATSTKAENEIIVPDEIDSVPVKVIGEHAFAGLSNVTSITLPDGVTEIGKQAFTMCSGLTSVNIPSGVKELGDEAFLNCTSLTEITLSENLASIGIRAFFGCSKLEEITIPDSVTYLGKQAFDSCTSLSSANIPKGITVLEDMVFNGCAIKELIVPKNINFIGKQALPKTLIHLFIVNPNCQIDEEYHMWNITTDECLISAPPHSSILEFASKYGFASTKLPGSLCDPVLMGDVNNNGEIDIADLVMLEKYLLGKSELEEWKLADLCEDGVIDSFDLVLMRKTLINTAGYEKPQPYDTIVNLSEGFEAQSAEGAKADDEFIMAQTKFALDLMQKSVSEDTNTLISPYSVMQALSTTANGADNETLAEIEKVLGGISIDKLNEYLYTQRTSQPNDKNCKLSTANSIWFRDDSERISVLPEFLQKNKTYYDSDSFKAPFDESTVKDINNWVNEKTDKMIPEVIKNINSNAVAFIINAVVFDAKWMEQYEENQVSSGAFTAYDGTIQDVEMLNSVEHFYLEDENASGIYKYYEGGKYAFAALLPDADISVNDYIAGLTPESLNTILSSPIHKNVYCSLPKFSYDYENELKDELQSMGMEQAFVDGIADFSKMAEASISIDKVIHKTHIELTESGTRSAAVTVVEFTDNAVITPDVNLVFDRPFVYCIVNTETSLPVFIGTLITNS